MKKYLYKLLILAVLVSVSCKSVPSEEISYDVTTAYPSDVRMWNHIFKSSQPFFIPDAVPYSIMIPHHDIALSEQNSFYKALSEKMSPKVVAVISPDHFEKGKKQIAFPKSVHFNTALGEVCVSEEIIRKLCSSEKIKDYCSLQDNLWKDEHGIFAHTAFIKKYFPEAEIVPVVLKPCSSDEEFDIYRNLASALNDILPEDSLLIASVDCSHYQIPRMTFLHDRVTKSTIQNGEDVQHLEVDSPESLTVLKEYNALKKASVNVLIHSTSTYDYIPDENVESTSHLYWCFYDGNACEKVNDFYREKEKYPFQRIENIDYGKTRNQTLIIGGSGDIGFGIRDFFTWDRYGTSKDKAEIILRKASGKEARFLSGFDAIIFDPEPGTVYSRKKHGTVLNVYAYEYKNALSIAVGKRKSLQEIDILFLETDGTECSMNDNTALKLIPFYDAVILHDKTSSGSSYLFVNDEGKVSVICLGKAYCPGKSVKGCLAVLDYSDGKLDVETFSYESTDGMIPFVNQFIEEGDF